MVCRYTRNTVPGRSEASERDVHVTRRRACAADERVGASRDDGERPYVYVCDDGGVALGRPDGGCGVAVSVSTFDVPEQGFNLSLVPMSVCIKFYQYLIQTSSSRPVASGVHSALYHRVGSSLLVTSFSISFGHLGA
jgi:hypothetical protein